MPRVLEKLRAFIAWLKSRPIFIFLGAGCVALISYGGVSGGLHLALSDANSIIEFVTGDHPKKPKLPHYFVRLVSIDAKPRILDPNVAPPGVRNVIVIGLTVQNLEDPVIGIMGKATANLGDHHQIEWTHSNRSLQLGTGVGATTEAAIIAVKNPEQEFDGRIDAAFLYGPASNPIAYSVPVKGQIGWEFVSGKWRLTFINDGDSAIPSGMKTELQAAAPLPPGF